MPRLQPRSAALLKEQHDVIGRWQMTRLERRSAARAVRRGEWQAPTHQVFFAGRGPLSDRAQLWVAVLHGGPMARLAGRTALQLHGWVATSRPPVQVVTPANVVRQRTPSWISLHRVRDIGGPAARPPRVDIHTATWQAASWARSDREAMFIVLSVLQQRLAHGPRLAASLPANCRRRRLVLMMVSEYSDGISSMNEHDFARLCRRHGLPEPVRQSMRRDRAGRVRFIDAEFQTRSGKRLRVEIEGMHHFNPDAFLADIDRHNDLVVRGDAFLRVLSFTLIYEPHVFMDMLRELIEDAAPQAA